MANAYHDNQKLRLRLTKEFKKETGKDIEIARIDDTDENLEFAPSKSDIEKSDRKTHTNCMLARCANRTVAGVVGTIVGTSKAFLVHKEGGKFVAVRYDIPPGTHREIVAFDRGGKPPKGTKLLLKAASPRVRLDNYIPQKFVDEMSKKQKAMLEKGGKVLGYSGGWRTNRSNKAAKRPLTVGHKAFRGIKKVRGSLAGA